MHAAAAVNQPATPRAGRANTAGLANDALNAFLAGQLRLITLTRQGALVFVGVARQKSQSREVLRHTERRIIDLLMLGRSQKQIGLDLGVCATTVNTRLHVALQKLQISRWEHLIVAARTLTGGCELGPRTAEQNPSYHSTARRQIGLRATVCTAALSALTEAEREVALYMLDGRSNAEIARLRQSSSRTVANQVGAIFRKLSTQCRLELILRLLTGVRAVEVSP